MKKSYFLLFLIMMFSFAQDVNAKMYECNYKNKKEVVVISSFNTNHTHRKDYPEILNALKTGNCKELYVKKYFIEGSSCNIQFYKYNMKIAGMTCAGRKPEAMKKLKSIARNQFGYIE